MQRIKRDAGQRLKAVTHLIHEEAEVVASPGRVLRERYRRRPGDSRAEPRDFLFKEVSRLQPPSSGAAV